MEQKDRIGKESQSINNFMNKMRLMHFEIQEINPERATNPTLKEMQMHEFANLEGNISCVSNSRCINPYIIHYKNDLFFVKILFCDPLTFLGDVNKV